MDLPRDPGFEAKAKVILDLYQGFYQRQPLGPGDRILSFDAKPSIQARGRIHATLPAAPGPRPGGARYVRHGALALLAGLDVHTGRVFASTPKTTGIVPFMDLAGQVMARRIQGRAPRLRHRGQRVGPPGEKARPPPQAHPNAIMIHTPVHAPAHQVEIFFSITRRKSSPRTTSPAWRSYPKPCSPSSTATTRPRSRSAGNTPLRPQGPAPPHQRTRKRNATRTTHPHTPITNLRSPLATGCPDPPPAGISGTIRACTCSARPDSRVLPQWRDRSHHARTGELSRPAGDAWRTTCARPCSETPDPRPQTIGDQRGPGRAREGSLPGWPSAGRVPPACGG